MSAVSRKNQVTIPAEVMRKAGWSRAMTFGSSASGQAGSSW